MSQKPFDGDRPGAAAWRVIEPYWETVSIYNGPIAFLEGFERLPEPARHLFAVWWCDAEVCNGGFHQFFSNSTGVLAPEALEGFQAIGLRKCAELVALAIGKFYELYPRDREARQAALQVMELPGEQRRDWDPFYALDDRYYAAREDENFEQRLDDYARRRAP
jgi:hypothetical protein